MTRPTNTADAHQGEGRILGVVIDEEAIPVESALVELLREGTQVQILNVTSDAFGGFSFSGLAPGTYIVRASKANHLPAEPKTVRVQPGETLRVSLELEAIRNIEPFHKTETYRVKFAGNFCMFALNIPVVCATLPDLTSPGNLTHKHEIDEKRWGTLTSLIVEVSWRSNIGACPAEFRTDVFSPQDPNNAFYTDDPNNPYHWDSLRNGTRSPTYLHIPRNGTDPSAMHSPRRTALNNGIPIQTSGEWTVLVAPYPTSGVLGLPQYADMSCAVDQIAEVYLTAFYVAPPPSPDWSALEP